MMDNNPYHAPQKPTDLSQEVWLQQLEKSPKLIIDWRRGLLTEDEFLEELSQVPISRKLLKLRERDTLNFDISEDYGQAIPAFKSADGHSLVHLNKLMEWTDSIQPREDCTLALKLISDYLDEKISLPEVTKAFKSHGWIEKSVTKRAIKKGRNHSSIYDLVYRALEKYKTMTREELIIHLSPALPNSKRPAAAIRQALRRGLEREFFAQEEVDGEVEYFINMNRPYPN